MRFSVLALLAAAFLGAAVNVQVAEAGVVPADGKPHVVVVPVAKNIINVEKLIVAEETRLRQLPIAKAVVGLTPANFKAVVVGNYDLNVTYSRDTDPFQGLLPTPDLIGRDSFLQHLANDIFAHTGADTLPVFTDITYEHPGKWALRYTRTVGGASLHPISILHFDKNDHIIYQYDAFCLPYPLGGPGFSY